MRYFGPLKPNSEVNEGKWKVKLKCYGNSCYYSRILEGQVKAERVLGAYSKLILRPTIYGGELAYYMYLHFKRSLTLIPYSSIQIMVGIPIDVEAVVEVDGELGRRSHSIDIIELSDIHYALYGKPERGILCRYHGVRIGSWNWISEAKVQIMIINQSEKLVTIEKLVFPTLLPEVYYEPMSHRAWVSPLDVLVERNTATVVRNEVNPPEGFLKNPSTGKVQRWTMIFGL